MGQTPVSMAHYDVPETRFAPTNAGRLAYQDYGTGSEIVVSIPPMAQNIEMAWEQPVISNMLLRLASFSRFIAFDKRSTGASDRMSPVPGIDERVEDLRAILDHAGVDRAHMMVASEGGPMAVLFAATYPNRVESLIFTGSGATLTDPNMSAADLVKRKARQLEFALEWGTQDSGVVAGFAPSLAGDSEFVRWHQRYERAAASSDSLRDLLDLSVEMDVTELLGTIRVPTLVLHRTGDRIISIERARELAAGIEGAVLIELEGNDHFMYAGDQAWLDDVERFVTGTVRKPAVAVAKSPRPKIATLGGFNVTVDGEAVPVSAWGSKRARTLCKRLVVARGWPVAREELMDLLWPDEFDPSVLSARLSVQLSKVRHVLGGGVVANRDTVQLDLDAVDCDVEHFLNATEQSEILIAYTGSFLPEDQYDDWSQSMRSQVRTHFVAAAIVECNRLLGAGTHVAAGDLARRVIDADPYNGTGHRTLVTSLLRAGLESDAREAFVAWLDACEELGAPAPTFEFVAQ